MWIVISRLPTKTLVDLRWKLRPQMSAVNLLNMLGMSEFHAPCHMLISHRDTDVSGLRMARTMFEWEFVPYLPASTLQG